MKLRYYLSGLGSGIIIAVLIMLIADKVTAVNNNVNGSNVPQETTGSVIAYTTQSEEDKVIVNINPKNIKVAADISKILKNKGVIEDADAFTQYMATYGYSRIVQQGNFELIKGDSYENIARIITRSDVDNNTNTQAD